MCESALEPESMLWMLTPDNLAEANLLLSPDVLRCTASVGRGGGLEVGGGGEVSLCERLAGGENERWGIGSGLAVFEMGTPLCVRWKPDFKPGWTRGLTPGANLRGSNCCCSYHSCWRCSLSTPSVSISGSLDLLAINFFLACVDIRVDDFDPPPGLSPRPLWLLAPEPDPGETFKNLLSVLGELEWGLVPPWDLFLL